MCFIKILQKHVAIPIMNLPLWFIITDRNSEIRFCLTQTVTQLVAAHDPVRPSVLVTVNIKN